MEDGKLNRGSPKQSLCLAPDARGWGKLRSVKQNISDSWVCSVVERANGANWGQDCFQRGKKDSLLGH